MNFRYLRKDETLALEFNAIYSKTKKNILFQLFRNRSLWHSTRPVGFPHQTSSFVNSICCRPPVWCLSVVGLCAVGQDSLKLTFPEMPICHCRLRIVQNVPRQEIMVPSVDLKFIGPTERYCGHLPVLMIQVAEPLTVRIIAVLKCRLCSVNIFLHFWETPVWYSENHGYFLVVLFVVLLGAVPISGYSWHFLVEACRIGGGTW